MSFLAPIGLVFGVRYVSLCSSGFTLTVLGGLLAFFTFPFNLMVCSVISDFPLCSRLLPGGSAILVSWYLCFFGGFVVGALDIF